MTFDLLTLPHSQISLAKAYAKSVYAPPIAGSSHVKRYKSFFTSAEVELVNLEGLQVLSWKGTAEPLDLIMNLTALPFPNRAGLCHAGFGLAHYSLWRKIKKDIDKSKRLLITGHSLGGACAEISAALLKSHPKPVSMITFGKPNVWLKRCDPDMSHLQHQISVVNGSDIVARIPRRFFGPSSTQTMLYFGLDNKDYVNPSSDLLELELRRRDMLKHHSMDVYDKRLQQLQVRMNSISNY
jgi:hypothetical protein